ncbi:MAG: MBOAT family protein [Clostridiales bacterium]|nr:MBOAT family protein [Clostridiales bacterium]
MTFNSGEFLIFYPITLLLYFLLPKKWSRYSLLLMSLIFYLAWNVKLIVLILFTTAVSYFCALLIEKTQSERKKKLCVTVALIACLGVLFFFKYYNFLAVSAGNVLGIINGGTYDFTLDLVLPVGISFYTFQTLSYVIDVYRGDEPAEHDFLLFALYVTFFPQLVAGPIERPGNLLPQLKEKNKLEADNVRIGLQKMAVGFFKKIVVADIFAEYVNSVFNAPESATGLGVILGSVFFAAQIYCDFSGYTDIAIGCSRVMGIRLMKNFDRPYKAKTVKEFWARWHISLSTWLRDYLYFPLGGSRCSKPRHMFNLFMVFFVSGLWHGANWTFVLWGVLHAAFRIVGELTYPVREKLWKKLGVDTSGTVFGLVRRAITFALICFSWIFFRANSVSDLKILLSKLFTSFGTPGETFSSMGICATGVIAAVLSVIVMTELDIITSDENTESAIGATRKTSIVWCVWAVAVAWIMLLSVGGASTFIYFQF